MFKSLEEITDGAQAGRSSTPVRRHSERKGGEGRIWQKIERADLRQIVDAAEAYEVATKREQPGSRQGALGLIGLRVLRLLADMVDRRTGRLDPSIETLMRKLGHSRTGIVAALKNLRAHGFLSWMRRYVATGNTGKGPQVQQTSNAYRLSLPERAKRLLGWRAHPVPVPDDFRDAQAQRVADIEAMRAGLSEMERTRVDVDAETPVGAAILRLAQARAMKAQREFGLKTESLFKFIS